MGFLTEDEIVDDMLLYRMTEATKKAIRSIAKSDLVTTHYTLGRWIRDYYELWNNNNPLTLLNHQEQLINGCDHSDYHPDNVSHRIICHIWRKLQ